MPWPYFLPQTLVIRWTGTQYEAIATYTLCGPELPEDFHPQDVRVAGIDLGEVHMAVSHDGEHTHILNGRLLRHKRQYQNRLKEHLSKKIGRKKTRGGAKSWCIASPKSYPRLLR